jgi:hypothetical protein
MSKVMVSGTANFEIHAATSASAQEEASSFSMGIAFTQQVDQSVIVKM